MSSSKHLACFLFLLLLMSACASPPPGPEPATVLHTYAASNAVRLNPERGFFTPYNLPGPVGFSPVRATGNTLVHLNIRLDDWRESDIPQDVLDELDANFADMRDAGVKAIIRFAYNEGPFPDSEPDASKAQVLRHIEQLTPLLQKNTDVIAWLEAGFIGAWGEWHTSTNGLDNITDKRDILTALVAAIPNRFVQVRYPANIIELYPDPGDAAAARVAHHNDCFLSSDTDVGTYERDGVNTIVRDQKYLAELTRTTPMSGETCAPFPPRSECESALQEMTLLHVVALNEAYHKGILRSWDAGGCMENIKQRLGYRLTLTSAEYNERVRPGGTLDLTVDVQNTGFGNIINERPLYVILFDQDNINQPYQVKLDIDPRRWGFGNSSFNVKLHIPANIPEGEYQIALWLPDAYESLQGDPRYAIQFANEEMWEEETGFNRIGTFQLDKSAGGISQRGNQFEVIESTALMEGVVPPSSPGVSPTPTTQSSLRGQMIHNPVLTVDKKDLFVNFEFVGDIASYNGFQVFLDIDQDPGTGLSIEGIGADFLIENGTLNKYAGSDMDWMWRPFEEEIQFSAEGQAARWVLPISTLGNLSKVDAVFQLVDKTWDTSYVTDKATFDLK